MKAFSIALAFVIALFVSGNASAANWVEVENHGHIIALVDKDSIRRGTDSKVFPKFNRTDGYSAIVKLNMKFDDGKEFNMVSLMSFYKKNGERMFRTLEFYEPKSENVSESDVIEEKVDVEGRVWPKVWDYIETNLK